MGIDMVRLPSVPTNKGGIFVRKMYNMKKTISMKQFITELGENFSEHMKLRLKDLGSRCVLTRKEDNYRLNLKHIEHTMHECAVTSGIDDNLIKKEYVYGQFVVQEGVLYFSEKCTESNDAVEASVVSTIYNSLNTEKIAIDEIDAKLVDDSNIDYIIDTVLEVCPPVSQAHLEMVRGMTYRSQK
jgi:hypothetical protein